MSDQRQPEQNSDIEHLELSAKASNCSNRVNPSKKIELLDVYIGAVDTSPKAAKRFNDLIAKTLKIQQ
jgi:hypothetical protein